MKTINNKAFIKQTPKTLALGILTCLLCVTSPAALATEHQAVTVQVVTVGDDQEEPEGATICQLLPQLCVSAAL